MIKQSFEGKLQDAVDRQCYKLLYLERTLDLSDIKVSVRKIFDELYPMERGSYAVIDGYTRITQKLASRIRNIYRNERKQGECKGFNKRVTFIEHKCKMWKQNLYTWEGDETHLNIETFF